MIKKLDDYREKLNALITKDNRDSDVLIKLSQELDKLILLQMKSDQYSKAVLGDGGMGEFDALVDKLIVLEKLYDSMRVVDPVRKKVFEIKDTEIRETDFTCYDFWQRNAVCDNCISMRAYHEGDTIFKIEYNPDSIYMVTAVPVIIKDQKLVVEFLKNAANSLYIGSGGSGGEIKVLSSIEYLNQAVVKDELTNLFNRRFINDKIPLELFNASIKDEPLSIIFIDLDHFKKINDTYGHSAGDQILRQFANELKHYIRNEDWVARYGGEEFLICLSNTELGTAKIVSERIREIIMNKDFCFGTQKINLTSSFGVHTFKHNEGLSVDEVIEIVDKKLYQAKSEGRNRVVC